LRHEVPQVFDLFDVYIIQYQLLQRVDIRSHLALYFVVIAQNTDDFIQGIDCYLIIGVDEALQARIEVLGVLYSLQNHLKLCIFHGAVIQMNLQEMVGGFLVVHNHGRHGFGVPKAKRRALALQGHGVLVDALEYRQGQEAALPASLVKSGLLGFW